MKKNYEQLKEYIDKRLTSTFNKLRTANHFFNTQIFDAMEYSVINGGKRVRPIMLLMAVDMFGGNIEKATPLAIAIELIHSYSLVHDDMPCMDNDDLRRGRPTTHKQYGDAMALLAGDGLLNLAMEIMTEGLLKVKNKDAYAKAMYNIVKYSGYNGMIGGQAVDISNCQTGNKMGYETLLDMYNGKTSSLFIGALTAAAAYSKASLEDMENIKIFGENLGLAFQIKDDLLEVDSSAEIIGKRTDSDIKNNKVTTLSFLSYEEAQGLFVYYNKLAYDSLANYGKKAESLLKLHSYLVNRAT